MVIGLSYLIKNQDPQCLNLKLNEKDVQASFLYNLVPKLCNGEYEYYSTSSNPTKYFFTLDIIGHVQNTELVHSRAIRQALVNSWSKVYHGMFSNLDNFNPIKIFFTIEILFSSNEKCNIDWNNE